METMEEDAARSRAIADGLGWDRSDPSVGYAPLEYGPHLWEVPEWWLL